MLGYLKLLPVVALVGVLGFGAHKWIVNRLETQIVEQQQQISLLNQHNVALQTAAATNEETIRSLEATASRQITQITNLTTQSAQWEQQAREYMNIFNDHNFTRLSRARPGLIESRANAATKEVFDSVEQDSKDTQDLNNAPKN